MKTQNATVDALIQAVTTAAPTGLVPWFEITTTEGGTWVRSHLTRDGPEYSYEASVPQVRQSIKDGKLAALTASIVAALRGENLK